MYSSYFLAYTNEHQEYPVRDTPVKQEPQRGACSHLSISHWPTTNISEGSVRNGYLTTNTFSPHSASRTPPHTDGADRPGAASH
jgi:hypothetical protein